MLMTLLMLSLLAADPAPRASPGSSTSALAVGVTSGAELEKVAGEAGRRLGAHLEAPVVEWRGYLKSRAPGCAQDARCLLAAPGLQGVTRLLHLRLRPLGGGRLAVDLRLIDVRGLTLLGRRAAVVEAGDVGAWSEAAATRLLARADPDAGQTLTSPFALQPETD